MRLTANISIDELRVFLDEALPARIELSEDHFLYFGKVREARFVAGSGLEVECHARIRWPGLGLHIPIEAKSAVVLLRPTIEHVGHEDVLAFRASLESLDVAHAPGMVERPIVHRLNDFLKSTDSVMCWGFQRTLDFNFPLPASIEPRASISLRAGLGAEVTITDDSLVITASLDAHVNRAKELGPQPTHDDE